VHSAAYREVPIHAYFANGPEVIDYVAVADRHFQGEVISPTRGVCDCYDMDDFTRAQTGPGPDLILRVMQDGKPQAGPSPLRATFASWSHIHFRAECGPGGTAICTAPPFARIQLVLKQAYHRNWRASGCETDATPAGNLILDCPAPRLLDAPVELVFRDFTSDRAARVSILSWKIWLAMAAGVLLAGCAGPLRARPAAA
jgi:hypothetical protein